MPMAAVAKYDHAIAKAFYFEIVVSFLILRRNLAVFDTHNPFFAFDSSDAPIPFLQVSRTLNMCSSTGAWKSWKVE